MNFKTTIILLALLAVVAAYFVFVDRGSMSTYEREQEQDRTRAEDGEPMFAVGELDADRVSEVTIEREGQSLTLRREDADWFQTEPVRFALNSYSAQGIVDAAAALGYFERFKPGDDDQRSPSVLDQPQAIVSIVTAGTTHTLRLGEGSLGGRRFLMRAGDEQVYIVNDALHRAVLDAKVTDWRTKSLKAPEAAQVDRVTLRHGDIQIELTKTDGRWFLDPNSTQRADLEAVEDLVRSVGSIYIDEFVSDGPQHWSVFGLDQPSVELSLRQPPPPVPDGTGQGDADPPTEPTGAAQTQPSSEPPKLFTLRIGAAADLKNESFFATWSTGPEPSAVVFSVGKSDVEKFGKSADDLRDPRIVLAKASDLRQLKVEWPDKGGFTLERSVQGWSFGDPPPGSGPKPPFDADDVVVSELIAALVGAEADGYSMDLHPGEQPAAVLTLYATGRTEPERLLLYGPLDSDGESQWAAWRDGETISYHLPSDLLDPLFEPVGSLRNRTILAVPKDQITGVTLKRDDGVTFTFIRERAATQPSTVSGSTEPDAVWKLQGQEEFEATSFDLLLGALAPLRVERWLEQVVAPQPGWAQLTIDVTDGSTRVLRADPESRRGTLSDTDQTFELSKSFVGRLSAEYRNRTVVSVTSDQIESIAVERQGSGITLRRDESDTYVSDGGQAVDQAAAAGIFDTMAGLRVQKYVTPASRDPVPTVRIQATTRDGDTVEVAYDPDRDLAVVTGAIGWCRLSESDVEKLLASLTPTGGEAGQIK